MQRRAFPLRRIATSLAWAVLVIAFCGWGRSYWYADAYTWRIPGKDNMDYSVRLASQSGGIGLIVECLDGISWKTAPVGYLTAKTSTLGGWDELRKDFVRHGGWYRLGFGFMSFSAGRESYTWIVLPYWILCLFLIVVPVLSLRQVFRRHQRGFDVVETNSAAG